MPDKLKLEDLGDSLYACPSFTKPNKFYILDVKERTCTCPAFRWFGHCKHLIALRRLEAFVEV